MGPERHLCLLPGRHIQPEELFAAAHAHDVDDRQAIRRPGRPGIGETVVGDIREFAGLQIDDEDVTDPVLQRRERDLAGRRGRCRAIRDRRRRPARCGRRRRG